MEPQERWTLPRLLSVSIAHTIPNRTAHCAGIWATDKFSFPKRQTKSISQDLREREAGLLRAFHILSRHKAIGGAFYTKCILWLSLGMAYKSYLWVVKNIPKILWAIHKDLETPTAITVWRSRCVSCQKHSYLMKVAFKSTSFSPVFL